MSTFGKKWFTHVTLVPKGAANYDITAGTAGITDMETALDVLTESAFGCGRQFPLIGNVTIAPDIGDANPCGRTEKLQKLTMTIAGLDTVADNANRVLLFALDGTTVNMYAYDKTSPTESLAVQGLGWVVKVIDPDESGTVDDITVELTEQYFGSTSSKVLPHTYSA